jgi:hypothetical protein
MSNATATPTATLQSPTRTMSGNRALLVASLIVAGLVHLAIAPEHLEESALIGGSMLAGAVAQLGLAFFVRNGVRSAPLAAIVLGLNAAFIGAWIVAVTVGLPVPPHPHAAMAAGLMQVHGGLGHLEPVSLLGLVTAGLEVLVIASVASMRSTWAKRG